MIEGCDYGEQASYFSQRIWAGETSFAHEVDKVEKARFCKVRERLTRSTCRSPTATGDNCVSSAFESQAAISTSENGSISNC